MKRCEPTGRRVIFGLVLLSATAGLPLRTALTPSAAERSAKLSPSERSVNLSDLRVLTGAARQQQAGMLLNYLVARAQRQSDQALAAFRQINSADALARWQNDTRSRFLELIGGLPERNFSLRAQITGEVRRDGYTIRKVLFQSLPDYWVTADLYVPSTGKAPYPGVLSPCGHSANGKAYDVYQHLFIGLVQRGYVVLAYDPMGQGERGQYWNFFLNRPRYDLSEFDHEMGGLQEYLTGQDVARYFIQDGLRALDYLETVPEVDRNRIGVTGSSGGGTLTTYISMLDTRVKAASIVTFITSLPEKIRNRINDAQSDPEQDIPGLLAAGIDHRSFLGLIAPRPVQIGAATQDFFPIAGTHRTYNEVHELYQRLGVPDRVRMVEFNHRHMYSQPLREATYAWFDHWLKGLPLADVHEPPITTEKDAVLQVTSTGQVLTSMGGRRIYDFNHAQAEAVIAGRRWATPRPADTQQALRNVLGLGNQAASPQSQRLATSSVGGIEIEKWLLTTEPGIVVPVRVLHRAGAARGAAVVYLRDRDGSEDDLDLFGRLANSGSIVFIADVRGFGETMDSRNVPDRGVRYFDPREGMDADFAYGANFIGEPLIGMRVWDALNVLAFARSRNDVDRTHIDVMGRGWAAPIALFTAAVDSVVHGVAVEGVPLSLGDVALADEYNQPSTVLVPGALKFFDISDVFASLAPRRALVINPTDAEAKIAATDEAKKELPVEVELVITPDRTQVDTALARFVGH